ncbi:MAG: 16S rRNA (cytosine(1402)-N(4))-methyltransferase RsmH [Patescibacteria group bacterium]|jgi:16S rRNA (cytosine1402-N4)-methyltransferase
MSYSHQAVLLEAALSFLKPQAGEAFIDGTLGGAGYTLALAQAVGPTGQVLAVDLDDLALENARQKIATAGLSNISLVKGNFRNLLNIVQTEFGAEKKWSGLVLDLGLSSAQLADKNRSFSFKDDRPLDMAFGGVETAAIKTTTIVNRYPLAKLAAVISKYGDEPQAFSIAQKIVRARKNNKIKTTGQLLEITGLNQSTKTRLHPATKLFQALRMETNQELAALEEVLAASLELLAPGGRLVVVSFHSGEDRIVKEFIKRESQDCICSPAAPVCVCSHRKQFIPLTKKPVIADEVENSRNPRARSAKLRAALKI